MADDVLVVEDLSVHYSGVHAVEQLSLTVPPGATVTLIGANGAGKTSTLRAIGGQVRSSGRVTLAGSSISGWRPSRIARHGLAQVPQGRRLFPDQTVRENLELGGYGQRSAVRATRINEIFELFPRLRERSNQTAGSLSGGEQQMVAIGRALMADPKIILMDEPSLGLAPIVVKEVFETIRKIKATGTAILLVEQNAVKALEVADYAYVLQRGRLTWSGPAEQATNQLDDLRPYLV